MPMNSYYMTTSRASALELRRDDWVLDERTVRPTFSFLERLNSSLYEHERDDFVIRFVFAPRYDAPDVLVHQSRLIFAGGPFQALAKEGFREHAQRRVELAECDNPQTFAVIRQFLYGKVIDLENASFSFILDAIRSSHRWELMALFHGLFDYILKLDLLSNADDVLSIAGIMSLPEVPTCFMFYFWDSVGRQFHNFSRRDEAEDNVVAYEDHDEIDDVVFGDRYDVPTTGPVQSRLCPRFPDLWSMAVNQEMVEYALRAILRFSEMQTRKLTEGLLDVILQYLEPRIANDAVVCALISELNIQNGEYCNDLLARSNTDEVCSSRAIRLMAKTLYRFSASRSTLRAKREASRRLSSDNRISTHLRLRAMKRSRSRSRMFLPELDSDFDVDYP